MQVEDFLDTLLRGYVVITFNALVETNLISSCRPTYLQGFGAIACRIYPKHPSFIHLIFTGAMRREIVVGLSAW
ncbi:MAG: hypothetical protein ACREBC_28675 [Pyrinomonadaceae bacterium]